MNTPASDLELWFDFSCPYAYLASHRAAGLARAFEVELRWKPMLLGGVFRGIGSGEGPMATLSHAKAAHNLADMHRWAEVFGVPLRVPTTHPMRTVRALRVLLALPHSRWPAAIEALFAAYWQRAEDITRDEAIAAALHRGGVSEHDIAQALARADDHKDELRERTAEAIGLGVFGAPAWIVRRSGTHILVWGQDRLPWVEAVLAGRDLDAPGRPGDTRARPRTSGLGPPWPELQGFASPHTLDVYFDVASPFAYLGLTQLPRLAETTGVVPRMVPILLGALFRAIGQVDVPLHSMPAPKQRYTLTEMYRWARWWGVPFEMPRKFPQRTVLAQRLCLLPAHPAEQLRLAIALGRAMWAEQRDLGDEDTLRGVLADSGLPSEWLERTHETQIKAALAERTAVAQAAGVFGVPTWIVNKRHLFWGQDRLELVIRALAGWRPEHG
jgi:2-hydroxychromene-2-carboxylate isomerase